MFNWFNKSKKSSKNDFDARIRLDTAYNGRAFAIVANNCWGAEIYKEVNRPFNTPFIGLYIYGPDYVKLLSNIDHYANVELKFIKTSKWLKNTIEQKYPIGILDDVEVHFLHYHSEAEAFEKWNKRMKRLMEVDRSNWFLKICDRDHGFEEVLLAFHELPFNNKISFAKYNLDINNHIVVEETEQDKTVVDGVRLFDVTNKYVDIIEWINTAILRKLNVK
ncbi:MAG: DUF1919 domain-containing protein [Taibaiella sp.]|nr:DUF1919 domain-containing protein [Taibaiella sp.]